MAKYTWTQPETFSAELYLANYSQNGFAGKRIRWSLTNRDGFEVALGQTKPCADGRENVISFGTIQIDLNGIQCPQQLLLSVTLEGTEYRNRYPIWVYGQTLDLDALAQSVTISQSLDQSTLRCLTGGGKVLLLPENASVEQAIPGAFQSDFWCYPMFKKYDPPGTMGILCDPAHPALKGFPTEFHSNWQWWSLLKNGCAMILDGLPDDLEPIVRVIDNFERNHRLGVIFECSVGAGQLLVCSCNLLQQQNYPEARQLFASLLQYMNSDAFAPSCSAPTEVVKRLLK
jgi:hypothetical protein